VKQLWRNFKGESSFMKWTMIVSCVLFGIVIGACTVQSHAQEDSGTFNGAHLRSPLTDTTLDRVDDGFNSCYVLSGLPNDEVKMSCVHTAGDRGSDEQQ
jgi:hypothetical protein